MLDNRLRLMVDGIIRCMVRMCNLIVAILSFVDRVVLIIVVPGFWFKIWREWNELEPLLD